MNTYIYAYTINGDVVQVKKIMARSYNDVKDKILSKVLGDNYGDFNYSNSEDWLEIGNRVNDEYDINLSDIHEIEEFE